MNKLPTILYYLVAAMGLGFSANTLAAPTVYIPLGTGNKVIAVDGANGSILATYTGVANPHGLVATPDGEYLIAGSLVETPPPAGAAANTPDSKLFLIHPAHGHVMSTIPVNGWTHHQAITPDGRYVISTHPTRGYVSVVDIQSSKVVQTIATGATPNYALITRDGKYAYVSNTGSATISVIDISTWKVTRTLEAGPGPEHMVFSPDEKHIYVANSHAGTVSVVVVETGKASRTITAGKGAHGLDLSDDGKTLFVSVRGENKLLGINASSGKVVHTLQLEPAPYHLNTIHGASVVYVSSSKKPIIWIVDQVTLTLKGVINLPDGEGHQMAIVP